MQEHQADNPHQADPTGAPELPNESSIIQQSMDATAAKQMMTGFYGQGIPGQVYPADPTIAAQTSALMSNGQGHTDAVGMMPYFQQTAMGLNGQMSAFTTGQEHYALQGGMMDPSGAVVANGHAGMGTADFARPNGNPSTFGAEYAVTTAEHEQDPAEQQPVQDKSAMVEDERAQREEESEDHQESLSDELPPNVGQEESDTNPSGFSERPVSPQTVEIVAEEITQPPAQFESLETVQPAEPTISEQLVDGGASAELLAAVSSFGEASTEFFSGHTSGTAASFDHSHEAPIVAQDQMTAIQQPETIQYSHPSENPVSEDVEENVDLAPPEDVVMQENSALETGLVVGDDQMPDAVENTLADGSDLAAERDQVEAQEPQTIPNQFQMQQMQQIQQIPPESESMVEEPHVDEDVEMQDVSAPEEQQPPSEVVHEPDVPYYDTSTGTAHFGGVSTNPQITITFEDQPQPQPSPVQPADPVFEPPIASLPTAESPLRDETEQVGQSESEHESQPQHQPFITQPTVIAPAPMTEQVSTTEEPRSSPQQAIFDQQVNDARNVDADGDEIMTEQKEPSEIAHPSGQDGDVDQEDEEMTDRKEPEPRRYSPQKTYDPPEWLDFREEMDQCYRILEQLKILDSNQYFHFPVDWQALGIPLYPEVIKNPMDFQTIETKFKKKQYENGSSDLFADDVRLIWTNAKTFNAPASDVFRAAEILSCQFEKLFQALRRKKLAGKVATRKDQDTLARLAPNLSVKQLGTVYEIVDNMCPHALRKTRDAATGETFKVLDIYFLNYTTMKTILKEIGVA